MTPYSVTVILDTVRAFFCKCPINRTDRQLLEEQSRYERQVGQRADDAAKWYGENCVRMLIVSMTALVSSDGQRIRETPAQGP